MKIRKFKAEDIHEVVQLFYETIHTVNANHYNKEQREAWAPEITEEFKKNFCESLLSNFSYVVEQDGQIIGFGDMNKDGYFDRLFTHKDYQGKGVASLIGIYLLQDAQNLGLKKITTQASETAKPAAEKRGFKVVQIQDKVHNGIIFRNYIMEKILD